VGGHLTFGGKPKQMKYDTPLFLGLLLWAMSSVVALSDGVASFNKVTTGSVNSLPHHKLGLDCSNSNGLTTVALKIVADKDHHLESEVYVTIHSEKGDAKPAIAIFSLKPEGVSKSFSVATDQLARVSITYRLRESKGLRCHVFDIDSGELPRFAARRPTEQAVPPNGP
jgi:hypothetical protein